METACQIQHLHVSDRDAIAQLLALPTLNEGQSLHVHCLALTQLTYDLVQAMAAFASQMTLYDANHLAAMFDRYGLANHFSFASSP
jgi:hypothetical protein